MSISGSLVDASVPEIIQFIYLGRSTGMLILNRDEEVARLGFHRGDIINASFDGLPRLGDLLVQRGLVERETIETLVGTQDQEDNWLNLGDMLVARKLLSVESLHEILTDLTRRTVFALLSWETGTFDFTRGVPIGFKSLAHIDESPELHRLKVRSEGVLLEAAHYLDEVNRRADGIIDPVADFPSDLMQSEPAPESGKIEWEYDDIAFELIGQELEQSLAEVISESPVNGMALPPLDEGLVVLSKKADFVSAIHDAVARDPMLHRSIREGIESWAIVDLRDAEPESGAFANLMPDFPVSGTIGILGGIRRAAEAYSAGVTFATSDELDDILACLRSLTNKAESSSRRPSRAVTSALERLRTVLREMQGREDGPNVALNLLNLVGEVVERAILLVVTRDYLTPQGAFGFTADQRPLALATANLRLPLKGPGALEQTARDGTTRTLCIKEVQLPAPLLELLGRPVYDRSVILPVRGVGKILGVVYTDNGSIPAPIDQIEILEIACGQVGVALENELLRRELDEARAL